jgi:predicted lipid-binding transport protein (Tim44 family)
MLASPPEPILVATAAEELPWGRLEPVPAFGVLAAAFAVGVAVLFVLLLVVLVFGITAFLASFAASSARAAAEGSVLTKVPVSCRGTAFCVASLASCGVTPMDVLGVATGAGVCAQTAPVAIANVTHNPKPFIDTFFMTQLFPKVLMKHFRDPHGSKKQCSLLSNVVFISSLGIT